ncbi:MAG: hypothetical protein QXT64_04810 [Desulfurococcaceae archaeon]
MEEEELDVLNRIAGFREDYDIYGLVEKMKLVRGVLEVDVVCEFKWFKKEMSTQVFARELVELMERFDDLEIEVDRDVEGRQYLKFKLFVWLPELRSKISAAGGGAYVGSRKVQAFGTI